MSLTRFLVVFTLVSSATSFGQTETRMDLPNTSSPLVVTVTSAPSALTLMVSPSPAYQQNRVTLTAMVTGSGVSPTGTVTFRDGATVLGSAALSAGKTNLSSSFALVGSHSLSASYAGDSSYQAPAR